MMESPYRNCLLIAWFQYLPGGLKKGISELAHPFACRVPAAQSYRTHNRLDSKVRRHINWCINWSKYNMKLGSASLFGRFCCGLSMAALVSLDGTRVGRADDFNDRGASLQELIVDPIMNTIHRLDERLTSAEAAVSSLAESFTSRRVVAQMLCVSDDSGAQTCISKAQLDSLLSSIARAGMIRPSRAGTEATALPTEEPVETTIEPVEAVGTKDPTPEQNRTGEKSVADQEPEHTGTVQSAAPAIVSYPEVTTTVESGVPSCDW
jgi:hypothetical protein